MPDPIDMPLMNALPDPAERVYAASASRAMHDDEAFMAELERKRQQHHQDQEDEEGNPPRQEDDTYERSYKENQDESQKMMHAKSKEDKASTGAPGQVIDIKV